jgi:hypothetical protein
VATVTYLFAHFFSYVANNPASETGTTPPTHEELFKSFPALIQVYAKAIPLTLPGPLSDTQVYNTMLPPPWQLYVADMISPTPTPTLSALLDIELPLPHNVTASDFLTLTDAGRLLNDTTLNATFRLLQQRIHPSPYALILCLMLLVPQSNSP